MDEIEKVSIWNKTQDEITIGDSVKVAVVVTMGFMAVSIAIGTLSAGVGILSEVRRQRRLIKLAQNDEVIEVEDQ